ncbi:MULTISPECIES: S1C family serine protease [Catenuloplanes]|uniref:S1-C subfamily serine protease n=1 Tax=Catenuloplanes niger TaxID=587534 RepID=A0AAE4CXF8_9ACTN|nr:trypsin-like peptidase domain-containing protein [Catenuloplanes niger]MDR7326548.1 S1-C subfamily serine protease [Catenuloplanes niger]
MQTDRRAPVVMTVVRDPASVSQPAGTTPVPAGTPPVPGGTPEGGARPGRRLDRRRLLTGAVAVWAVVITGLVVFQSARGEPAAVPSAAAPSPSASEGPLSVPQIYEAVLPSVVRITAGGSTGTGVLANADGTVLTAHHVVDNGQAITVTYPDGSTTPATIARAQPDLDIAVLRPDRLPETLVPATLGGAVGVGAAVVAIGNPLGLTGTTTSGVVSALDRTLDRGNEPDLPGLIQFDAAVNPGSSGGPLINDRAEVVGIVVALANPTDAGTFIGIGFAVPIGAALGASEGDGQAPPL